MLAPVGVPVIAPVEPLSVSPDGNEPEAMLQVYGVVPLCPARIWEYEVPTTPFASAVVTMKGEVAVAVMVMLSCLDTICTGELLSVN